MLQGLSNDFLCTTSSIPLLFLVSVMHKRARLEEHSVPRAANGLKMRRIKIVVF